ncbi:MAG: putative zinc-binding metallopeptidase [Bacteriovoracaceae bacterium]|nr:putative zinc-binding metallopeptidase [Bacteriovoracaceae bacterium]
MKIHYSKKHFLDNISKADLYDLKLSKLNLHLKHSSIKQAIGQVQKELIRAGLLVKPNFWISDEWFCPDGINGIAVPFHLIHPRLVDLERSVMGYVEGDNHTYLMKLLRHELGHVIDNAYNLRRNRMRQTVFGKSSIKYPTSYRFKPFSRQFVKNLDYGYAQSHPAEDFAETFAVWLDATSNWKKRYSDWQAKHKLECMDVLMRKCKNVRPPNTKRAAIDPISTLDITLKEFYKRKKIRFSTNQTEDQFWDCDLIKIFAKKKESNAQPDASTYLHSIDKELCKTVSQTTGNYQYIVKQMIEEVIERVNTLQLVLPKKQVELKSYLSYYLTNKAYEYKSTGRDLTSL